MRYIKVLLIATFFFVAMVFFFQNQAPLSQEAEFSLNLFFLPPMTSMPLPFYFVVISAFFIGAIMAMFFLMWDKFTIGARLMKSRWQVTALQREVDKLNKKLAAQPKALPEGSVAVSATHAPADEQATARA